MKIQNGHVAVITGAGGGIGRALACGLAEKGCALALVDISREALDKTIESLGSDAGKVTRHVVDVTNREQMKALSEAVVSEHGGVNLLINNAGITLQKNFSTHSLEDWDRIVGINFWGVIHGCHFFDEVLQQTKSAHVVNLSSMASFLGLPAQSSYCSTKAAVELLSASLWAEWGARGIGVTHVHPGAIRTEMIKATLEDSDDVDAAKKNYDLAMKVGMSAEMAADKIIRAVEKSKKRVRIGKDSFLFDYVSRFAPGLANFAMTKIAQKQVEIVSR